MKGNYKKGFKFYLSKNKEVICPLPRACEVK